MCNTCVDDICVIHKSCIHIIHIKHHTCITCVAQLAMYTCNIHTTPYMYYMCDTTGHVSLLLKKSTASINPRG